MKFRKKGPIEVKIQSEQGKTFTFQFDLIDFVPRDRPELRCCSFCPYENTCEDYPDPRDLEGSRDFNDFCAAMDDEIGEGKWVPIPDPNSVDNWLKEINEIKKES
jgi:hypothetical protein